MATSGITGQTIFTTQQVIDRAFSRAKIPPEVISGEMIATACENLWLLLQRWASRGAPVWKIEKMLFPLYQGEPVVPAGIGSISVLNANIRTMQRLTGVSTSDAGGTPSFAFDGDLDTACTQIAPDGSITLDLGSETTVTTIGLLPNATGTWSFVYEVSQDDVTYETVATFEGQAVVTREWLWNDYAITRWPSYRYVRLRAIDGTTLDVAELYVANNPQAVPMAPINKDDYFSLPNKSFPGRPVQFWQDPQREQPLLKVWPVPDEASNFRVIEAMVHRAIQDVGTMTQELDLPRQWFDAVVWSLAEMCADDTPDYKGDIARVERKAQEARNEAWGGVTGTGPTYITPNISHYTRG